MDFNYLLEWKHVYELFFHVRSEMIFQFCWFQSLFFSISNNFGEQRQSWFEYQRTGRLKSLCSAVARRSAAVARRHSQSKPEVIGNLMPQTFSAIPVTFLHPGTPIPSSRNESDPT